MTVLNNMPADAAPPLLPLNAAESVFAPFHDPELSSSLPFTVTVVDASGVSHSCNWDRTVLQWSDCSAGGEAAVLHLAMNGVPARFDELIFSLTAPPAVAVRFEASVDEKWVALGETARGTGKRMEVRRPFPRGLLRGVRARFTALEAGTQHIGLHWFALAEGDLQRRLEAVQHVWNPRWPGLIESEEKWQSVQFARGLLFDADDLDKLREKKSRSGWREHFAVLEARARKFMTRMPEDDLDEYLPWSDIRYLRAREQGKDPYFWEALTLGFVGLINEDKAMQRHALRYLMCMAHTKHWCQSGESRLTGSTWDQRCFMEEMASTSVALLLDWFDFALTPRAKSLIRQALWDKGLAFIERDMMKHEYVYHNNQGPWFCRARVLSGLMLEASWPRVGRYSDRAFADMRAALDNYLLPDGGTDEGLGYFSLTLHATLPATIAYARARQLDAKSLLPKNLAQSETFLATMSAVELGRVLLDGDNSTDYLVGDTIPILAGFFPDSTYTDIVGVSLLKERPSTYFNQYVLDGLFGFVFGPDELPPGQSIVPTFSILPQTGHLTSFRQDGRRSIRLHLAGSKANPGHSHFDKGGFTAELDGTPFLIDRGMVRYDDARVPFLKQSALHNVLTPCYDGSTFPDQEMPSQPVIPTGRGDGSSFEGAVNLNNVWREQMKTCRRSMAAPSFEAWTVRDTGQLLREGQVVFHLQSPFPFEIKDKIALVQNGGVRLEIAAPWAQKLTARQELIDFRFEPIYHLLIWSGRLIEFDVTTTFRRLP